MRISSFDVFDTCLVRKCGAPENLIDVLSFRVFNGKVGETVRQEFVAARFEAQQQIQNCGMTLRDIYDNFKWNHPLLKPINELYQLEQATERDMLVPVLSMRDKVNECRSKGYRIMFISDMYLSSSFLGEILKDLGFMQEDDKLYVSCECGAEKYDGGLFRFVKEHERVSYHRWHHYGDNKFGDFKVPRKLGIHATLIKHEYTPYQCYWKKNDYSLGFRYASVMAGIARSIKYSMPQDEMIDFMTDIVAPLYIPFAFRIMNDAESRNIRHLYFCARDAFLVYSIAKQIGHLYPKLEPHWLYISKTALYEGNEEAKMHYFKQVGLASKSEKTAIVDIRSSGRTQSVLNGLMEKYGFNKVFGYYFEEGYVDYEDYGIQDSYYTEANGKYVGYTNANCRRLFSYWQLFEQFFSLQDFRRTIDYQIVDGVAEPVFDEDNSSDYFEGYIMQNHEHYIRVQEETINEFLSSFINLGLRRYVSEVFNHVSMPTLCRFTFFPERHYLSVLENFSVYNEKKQHYSPYVKRMSFLGFMRTKGTTALWHRATLVLSTPKLLVKWYKRKREEPLL